MTEGGEKEMPMCLQSAEVKKQKHMYSLIETTSNIAIWPKVFATINKDTDKDKTFFFTNNITLQTWNFVFCHKLNTKSGKKIPYLKQNTT